VHHRLWLVVLIDDEVFLLQTRNEPAAQMRFSELRGGHPPGKHCRI
jgi:hypothetical protein